MDFEPKTPKHFLIVDDDEIFCQRLALALSMRGFQTETATSLASAHVALSRKGFDVLVTDLRIAEESGLELVKAIQRDFPQTKTLVLTGYGSLPVAVTAMKLGASEFLSKPADTDEILEVLGIVEQKAEVSDTTFSSPDLMRWRHVVSVFESTGKNISKTARQLNMHRRTLQRLLARGEPKP